MKKNERKSVKGLQPMESRHRQRSGQINEVHEVSSPVLTCIRLLAPV